MINEQISVGAFFQQLIKRRDGQILFIASLICIAMLVVNIFHQFSKGSVPLSSNSKWVVFWIFMPIVLFFVHIRVRQLVESESFLSVFVHGASMSAIVGIFALKNWGVV